MRNTKDITTTIKLKPTHQVVAFAIALLHTCNQTEDALRAIAAYFHYDIKRQA